MYVAAIYLLLGIALVTYMSREMRTKNSNVRIVHTYWWMLSTKAKARIVLRYVVAVLIWPAFIIGAALGVKAKK